MRDRYTLNISLPTDGEGMVGRKCPNADCGKYFKVTPETGIEDNDVTVCPYCESENQPDEFTTPEQLEYAKSIAMRHVSREIHRELKKLERHSFKGDFISMDIKVKRGTPPRIHRYVERELQETLCCERCKCEYAIYSTFAVCPDCGKQNLFQVIDANLDLIERQLVLRPTLEEKFGEEYGAEIDEMFEGVGQKIVEDACENTVTAFETFFKELNRRYIHEAEDPDKDFYGNLFQRLDGTRDWFDEQYDIDIFAKLDSDEIDNLYLLFNKRHILTHNLGIIDEKYLQKTDSREDLLNRKVEVSTGEVRNAIDSVRQIVADARQQFRSQVS